MRRRSEGTRLGRVVTTRSIACNSSNTVIGKMSGVVTDPLQIRRDGLVPLVEGGSQAVLVEEFNRILISQITLPDFRRGIDVFQEKADLLPFEEAKLYRTQRRTRSVGISCRSPGDHVYP